MWNLPQKCKNCLKKFTEWGATAGFVCYLIEGELANAMLVSLIFGLLVIIVEYYSAKYP